MERTGYSNAGRSRRRLAATADPAEIAKFASLAGVWWDEAGPMAPLHAMNPARLLYIRDNVCRHFGRDPSAEPPFAGLTFLDAGCGAGLLSEPLRRLGGNVTGIDAAAENIAAALAHAREMGLDIAYRHAAIETLAAEGCAFDAVFLMEIVEHVADVRAFIAAAARLVRPGGLVVASTLNRTMKSFSLAILGAEYVLRWLPKGTHDWRRFVKPSELAAFLREAGFTAIDVRGVTYDPSQNAWRLSSDASVNYLVSAAAGR